MSAALLLLCAGLAVGVPVPEPVPAERGTPRVDRVVAAMGTTLEITVEAADRAAALAASEVAVRALAAVEARLSTWRTDSELQRLNAAPPGERFPLSEELAAELGIARDLWRLTGGAFDPAIGPLVRSWGLRTGGRVPGAGELRDAVAASRFENLVLAGRTATRRDARVNLEEGAWGKGAGLDAALRALRADGRAASATLNLGGQVAVYREAGGREDWTLALADPRRRDRAVLALTIDQGSVSTSGNSEHGIEVGGRRYGHLLDPRTGQPAADFGSLTVWAPGALAADALSTALFVLGPQRALRWAGAHPGVEVVVLEELPGGRLRARATAGLARRLSLLGPGVDLAVPTSD